MITCPGLSVLVSCFPSGTSDNPLLAPCHDTLGALLTFVAEGLPLRDQMNESEVRAVLSMFDTLSPPVHFRPSDSARLAWGMVITNPVHGRVETLLDATIKTYEPNLKRRLGLGLWNKVVESATIAVNEAGIEVAELTERLELYPTQAAVVAPAVLLTATALAGDADWFNQANKLANLIIGGNIPYYRAERSGTGNPKYWMVVTR